VDAPHVLLIVLTVAIVALLAFLRRRGSSGGATSLRWTRRIGRKPKVRTLIRVQRGQIEQFPGGEADQLLAQAPGMVISTAQVNVSGTVSQLAELMSPGIASVMKETGAVQQLTTRGMTLMEDRKFDEAIAELGKAVTLARHNLYASGSEGLAEEGVATSMERMTAAVAHCNLGMALQAKGDLDRAIVELREGLRVFPNLAPLHDGLGNALADKGDSEGAAAEFREALRLQPDLAAIHTQSGDTLAARGNVDVAIAEYRKALRLSPDLQQAQNGLQAALAKKGEGHS